MRRRRRDQCEPPRRGNRVLWYVRARLHRRLFLGYALSILATGFVVGGVLTATRGGASWRSELSRVQAFAARRFGEAWADAPRRDALARGVARDLDLDVTLFDPAGRALATYTPAGPRAEPACARPSLTVPVREGGVAVGSVRFCTERHHGAMGRLPPITAFAAVIVLLWALAGVMARRITRPLTELVRVVQDIGRGRLASRMQLTRHDNGELGAIAHAVNDMAARIERQIEDQRDLLAAVSHELRSPLARMRFMVETLRPDPAAGDAARGRTVDELDREMEGIDALVGDLLATSRMDFEALRTVALDPGDVAARALERCGLGAGLRAVDGDVPCFQGDATLVHTALTNLVSNARKHGGAVTALRVSAGAGRVRFAVDDDGDGFAERDLARAFEPFYRGDGAQGEPRGRRAGAEPRAAHRRGARRQGVGGEPAGARRAGGGGVRDRGTARDDSLTLGGVRS